MIYFYCIKPILHFVIDYLESIQVNYNNIEILDDYNILSNNVTNKDIIIFIQNLPYISPKIREMKYYLLNIEQLSKEEWVNKLTDMNNVKIIDYSLANIGCLSPHRFNIYYLPYMVNRKEIMNYEKIYDIASIGCWDDSYRLNITNQIAGVNIIEGYGKERDDHLFKHKILLNVHFNKRFQIFEQIRCNRCIMNKMIVITEKSLDNNYELKKYIIECEYDDLVSTVKTVLENYDYYYHKLFDNFDIDAIEKNYKEIADKTIGLL